MTSAFYFFYRTFGWPVLRSSLSLLSPFVPKIEKGLALRGSQDGKKAWATGVHREGAVWIHCASGEFEYAKPVIQLLKKQNPSTFILVTYFSPSYIGQISKFQGVDAYCPLPWDSPRSLAEFFDYHRPRVLLIARTDVWPEMAKQTRLRGIPSLLFSATLTAKSGRARGLGRWMSKATFSQLSDILAVSDEDKSVFDSLELGNTAVTRAGDTRYDQVVARLAQPKPIRDELFKSDLPIVVCGSTWPEDEAVLIEAARALKNQVRFVFAPHEPSESHLNALEVALAKAQLTNARYTQAASWNEDVLLIDTVGILAEIYMKADFAFVGGSFKKNIHSVMEPLAAGCVTFVGPFHANNREALALKEVQVADDLMAVQPIRNSADLVKFLRDALALPRADLKKKVRDEIDARTGASRAVVDWVQKNI